jgi:hypothetical protein
MHTTQRLLFAALAALSVVPGVRAQDTNSAAEGDPTTIDRLTVEETGALIEALKMPGKPADAGGDKAIFRLEIPGTTAILVLERPIKVAAKEGEKPSDRPKQFQTYSLIATWRTKTTLQRVNEWNSTTKWSKAWLNDDGEPVLECDLDLSGGVTASSLVSYFQVFQASVPLFQKKVVDPKPAAK